MIHLKKFEGFNIKSTFNYKVGDFVKYDANKSYVFIIDDVDEDDYYKPYLIKIINEDPDALIVGNGYWVNEDELYTNEETEKTQNHIKYNL